MTTRDPIAHKNIEGELQRTKECLEIVEEAASAGAWSWSRTNGRIEGSLEWLKLHGFSPERPGLPWAALRAILYPEDRALLISTLKAGLKCRSTSLTFDYRVVLPAGQLRWISASARCRYDDAGELLDISGVCLNLTERKRREEAAAQATRDFELFFNLIPDLACIVSTDGYFKKINPAWEKTLGFTMEEVLATPMLDFIHPDDLAPTRAEIARQGPNHRTKHFVNRYRCKDGSYRVFNWTTTFIRDGSTRFGLARDVTEQQLAEKAAQEAALQIAHSAEHDFLTGLPNRMLLNDRVTQAISLARRQSKRMCVLFLDLDGFKHINDSLGHQIGDKLLQSISKRLVACVRGSDTVSRQGGDEFIILLSELEQTEDSVLTTNRILQAVAEPHSIGSHELHVTASIGVSVFPDDGQDAETLIRNADTAMYHAKDNGRQNCQFFKPAMKVRAVERQSIEESLRRALERQELSLLYQPRVDVRTGETTGAEALLRWNHPSRGLVSPSVFIPVAEDCGLIRPIGRWVLREACRQASEWQQAGLPRITMAVNISAMEFRSDAFLPGIFEILAETNMDPGALELEITESVLMKHSETAAAILKSLRARGVRVSIDDFGTGYSSLSYLRKFPVDSLKIDPSFVRQITTTPGETGIVTAVINMARSLNLTVVAEGVETQDELNFLQNHQCHEAQGYFFSPPVSPRQFAMLLEADRRKAVAAVLRDASLAPGGLTADPDRPVHHVNRPHRVPGLFDVSLNSPGS